MLKDLFYNIFRKHIYCQNCGKRLIEWFTFDKWDLFAKCKKCGSCYCCRDGNINNIDNHKYEELKELRKKYKEHYDNI